MRIFNLKITVLSTVSLSLASLRSKSTRIEFLKTLDLLLSNFSPLPIKIAFDRICFIIPTTFSFKSDLSGVSKLVTIINS